MTTAWPSGWRMRSPMMRAAVSVDPPGGKGTISVIGRAGKDWACAMPATTASANAATSFLISIRPYVGFFHYAPPFGRVGLDLLHRLRGRQDLDIAAGGVDRIHAGLV